MTNVRAKGIDPLNNLTQTAYDLASYLRRANPREFIQTAEEVRKQYNAPRDSWITRPFYVLFNIRTRTEDLDKLIADFQMILDTHRDVGEYGRQKPVLTLIDKGGWKDTSANTNFLRHLVKKVPGYNPDVTLTVDEVLKLLQLLNAAFEERIRAEVIINEQQKKIRQIDRVRIKKEGELFKKQAELLGKVEELLEYTNKLADLEKKESTTDARLKQVERSLNEYTAKVELIEKEKLIKESELKNLEQEKALKESELEATRKILTALNSDFDMKGLNKNQLDEVVTVAKMAVSTYKKQINEQQKTKNEFNTHLSLLYKMKLEKIQANPIQSIENNSEERLSNKECSVPVTNQITGFAPRPIEVPSPLSERDEQVTNNYKIN